MDYFSEGEKVRKSKDMIGVGYPQSHNFEKYVYDFVFKNANSYNKAEFVRGLLRTTKNQTIYSKAIGIAKRETDNLAIWENITYALSIVLKAKKKPEWGFNIIDSIFNNDYFKMHNYNADKIVWLWMNYDDSQSSWWIQQLHTREYFKNNKEHFERAVLKYSKDFDMRTLDHLFNIFKNIYFYRKFVDNCTSPTVLTNMLRKLNEYNRDIDGFIGGFEIDQILEDAHYIKMFNSSADAINHITSLIQKFFTPKTGSLFVELLNKVSFTEESMTLWLMKIQDIKSEDVFMKLFELTGNLKYLPEELHTIFFTGENN